MKEEIKELRDLISDDLDASELLDEIESEIDDLEVDLNEQITSLESDKEDLQDELDSVIDINSCQKVESALGTIYIYCDTGNLKLQEHIDSFLYNIKKRHG